MIPILINHDYSRPVGKLQSDGSIKLLPDSGVTVDDLFNVGLGYIPRKTKTLSNGEKVVTEAELIELSIIIKQ